MHPKKNRNNMKIQNFFVEVYEAGSVRSLKTVGNPAGAAALQNGAFPAKITLPDQWEGQGSVPGEQMGSLSEGRILPEHMALPYI